MVAENYKVDPTKVKEYISAVKNVAKPPANDRVQAGAE